MDVQRAAHPKTVHAKRQEIYHVLLLASVLIDRCPSQTESNPPKLMFCIAVTYDPHGPPMTLLTLAIGSNMYLAQNK